MFVQIWAKVSVIDRIKEKLDDTAKYYIYKGYCVLKAFNVFFMIHSYELKWKNQASGQIISGQNTNGKKNTRADNNEVILLQKDGYDESVIINDFSTFIYGRIP